MFKVVWKSFKYNRKNFLSFFMSEILSVAVIFMLIYIQEALSQVPGIKTEALQFAYQSELRKQLRIIIPCIILIMILVTGYSVKAYINTRIWDAMLDTWESEHQILISQLEEQEKLALQTKVKILEERYQEMLKSRKVVHDMKNHILALKNYDQEQNWSGLHEYLNELSDDMLEYNFHIWTGNHMLDMILNQKEKDAQNQNTVMQIDTEVFSTLPFTDREIISLFGNLLDNALEACEKISDKERWIKIKIKKKNLLLYIEIANALEQRPKQIQKKFVSNKKDNGLHGYGMKNIQDIVKKYDGIFQYKVYEDQLIFMISIYTDMHRDCY